MKYWRCGLAAFALAVGPSCSGLASGAEPAATEEIRLPSERAVYAVLEKLRKESPRGDRSIHIDGVVFGDVSYSAASPDLPPAFRSGDKTESVFPEPSGFAEPGAPRTSEGSSSRSPGLQVSEQTEFMGDGQVSFQSWTISDGRGRRREFVGEIRGTRDEALLALAAASHRKLEATCHELIRQRDEKQATALRQVGKVLVTLHLEKQKAASIAMPAVPGSSLRPDPVSRRWSMRVVDCLDAAAAEAVAVRVRYALNYRCPETIGEVTTQAKAIGADRIARDALLEALRHANGRVRIRAAYGLWRLDGDGKRAVSLLRGELAGPDAKDRVEAVLALSGFARSDPSVSEALKQALRDKSGEVRTTAALGLCQAGIHDAPVVQGLIESLKNPDLKTRVAAVAGLRQAGPGAKVALPALRAMVDEKDTWLLYLVAQALWEIGRDKTAALSCVEKLAKSDNERARLAADELKAKIARESSAKE